MDRCTEYLNKEAGGSALRAGAELSENAFSLLGLMIAVPAAAGLVSGVVGSKMTSPADSDIKSIQDRVMDVKVREELGLQQRKMDALKRKLRDQSKKAPVGRKRDMFV